MAMKNIDGKNYFVYDINLIVRFDPKDSAYLDEIAEALGPEAKINPVRGGKEKTNDNFVDISWQHKKMSI
jgi:hypothetical protein